MNTVVFDTEPHKGIIHLPKEYSFFNNKKIKVIILSEEDDSIEMNNSQKTMELLNELLNKTKKNKLFSSIIDPVEWQKKIRNEWT